MNRWRFTLFLFILPLTNVLAHCDQTHFRWECDIPFHEKPASGRSALIYCGQAMGYLSQDQYDTLVHYQQADINMVLKINGEYLDSPCLPNRRY